MRSSVVKFFCLFVFLYGFPAAARFADPEGCEDLLYRRVVEAAEERRPLVQLPLALAGRENASVLLHQTLEQTKTVYSAPLKLTLDAPDLYLHDFFIQMGDAQIAVLQGDVDEIARHARHLIARRGADPFQFDLLDDRARATRWDQGSTILKLYDSLAEDVLPQMEMRDLTEATVYDVALKTTYYAFRDPELNDPEGLRSLGIEFVGTFDRRTFALGAHAWRGEDTIILSDSAFNRIFDFDHALSHGRTPISAEFAVALGLEPNPFPVNAAPPPPPARDRPPAVSAEIHPLRAFANADDAGEPSLSLRETEMMAISDAMLKHNGKISRVAKQLGIGRSTLYRRLRDYDMGHLTRHGLSAAE